MDQNNATVIVADAAAAKVARRSKVKGLPPASRIFDVALLAAAAASASPNAELGLTALEVARIDLNKNADAVLKIGSTADSVSAYVKGFHEQAPLEGTGGYSSFVTKDDAYTNRSMLDTFTVDGVARQMALLLNRAAQFMVEGGDNGKRMAEALEGLNAYQAIAVAEAKAAAEDKALNDTLATLAKARGCSIDEARQLLAAFAAKPSAPVVAATPVVADESTIANSDADIDLESDTEGASDVDETADETADVNG